MKPKKLTPAQQVIADKSREKPDYFAWEIVYRHPEQRGTSACMGSGHYGEEKATAQFEKERQYYLDLGCSIVEDETFLICKCGACEGTGSIVIPGKRKNAWTPRKAFFCPFCNGLGVGQQFNPAPPVLLSLSEPVEMPGGDCPTPYGEEYAALGAMSPF